MRIGRLECGVILWECKRTASWGAEWSRELAGEVRAASARFGVIVSDVLPAGTEGSGQVGEVWASDYGHAWHLAEGLRQAVIAVHRRETANAARTGIAEKVYDYIATGGFEARYKTMEQAIDRLESELGRISAPACSAGAGSRRLLLNSVAKASRASCSTSSVSAVRSLPPHGPSSLETIL